MTTIACDILKPKRLWQVISAHEYNRYICNYVYRLLLPAHMKRERKRTGVNFKEYDDGYEIAIQFIQIASLLNLKDKGHETADEGIKGE